jgi:hypothetical protein
VPVPSEISQLFERRLRSHECPVPNRRVLSGCLSKFNDGGMICQFNWDDMRRTLTLRLPTAVTVTDDSTGESLGRRQRELSFEMERVRRGFAS